MRHVHRYCGPTNSACGLLSVAHSHPRQITMTFPEAFIWGLVSHIVADWFLQNDWMAQHKTSLKHSAAWIHSGIHGLCFAWMGWWAFAIFATHILIDIRTPLIWWRKFYRMKLHDPNQDAASVWNQVAMHVAFWQDQMAHVLVIAIIAKLAVL